MRVKQAVFLVGGRGTRLGSKTAGIPKPLLEVAPGLRFLDILIDQVARHGFTEIILLAGYLGEQVEALYGNRRVRNATVRVLRESAPAGTGGALTIAADHLDHWFLLANGDSLFDINPRALAAGSLEGFVGRLALHKTSDVSRYGSVELAGDRVVAFGEKRDASAPTGLINGGIYLLSREILGYLRNPSSLENEIFPFLAQHGRLRGMLFNGYFLDIGLPETFGRAIRELPDRLSRPAVFLDRDGVLNVDDGYTFRPEQLVWVPGARESVLKLNEAGYLVFVVTNQAGIARNLYNKTQLTEFHEHMQNELAEIGAHIDEFYYCPFHPDAVIDAYRVANHPHRKPNPGMILSAMDEWPVDRARSFLVGDRDSDIEAARQAGVRGRLFKGGDLRKLIDEILCQDRARASN